MSSSPERHFCERWLQWTARQNEASRAEIYCSLEEGCSGDNSSGSIRISQRATCLVFAPAIFNRYAEHLRKLFFFLRRYSRDTQRTMWVLISCCLIMSCTFYLPQSKIEYCWSKNCSAGNPLPRGKLKRIQDGRHLKKI
jgi:hypothetical protein